MTLYASALWFYSAMASLVFGASLFESVVIHPAWSRKPPESFVAFMASPISRLNLPSFWIPVAPLYALSALFAIAVAYRQGTPGGLLMLASACSVLSVVWTLAYFRPTVERFLKNGGGNAPAERLQSEARRWIALNWVRVVLVAIAWWGVQAAVTARG